MKESIKLREWSGVGNTTHVATSYRIATDESMTNIVDELDHSTTNLTLYNSNVTIPLNDTYYVSVKRFLLGENNTEIATDWTSPVPMRNYELPTGVMVENDIVVDLPFIYVDKEEVLDNSKAYFTFRTSSFRSNTEGHSATHYFIYDITGKLIYSNMNETKDKLAMSINKVDINLYSMTALVFKVIHVTPTGIESPVSTLRMDLIDSNVNIVSRLSSIVPHTDYPIKLSKVNPDLELGITAIELLSIDETDVLWKAYIVPGSLDYTIPYTALGPDSKYILKITTTDGYKVVYIKKVLTTVESFGQQRKQPSYKYDNNISYESSVDGPIIAPETSYTTLNNGKLIAKEENSNHFNLWDVDIITHSLSNPVRVSGLDTLTANNDPVYVEVRDDGYILIDCLNTLNIPTFLVYKYDSYRNTAVLLNNIQRPAETYTNSNNGVVRDNENIYYYIPKGSNYINKFDISTGIITKVYTIDNNSEYNILTRVQPGKLAIITGGSDILSYDLLTGEVYNVLTLPVGFRNKELSIVNLINNDILISIKNPLPGDNERVLSYDSNTGMLRTVNKLYTGINVKYNTSILLSNGEVIFIENTDNRDNYYIYV